MVVAATGMLPVAPAEAATVTVTNLNDSGPGSLRDAITTANGTAGADVINFQAGLTGTITLTTGQLNITDSVTIDGPGAGALSVSGNDASRVFYLYSSSALLDVAISGLTLTHGSAADGGAVQDRNENLTLDDVVLSASHASNRGGALWMDGFSFHADITDTAITGNTGSVGGGVYVEDTGGTLNFTRTTVTGNHATVDGGGLNFYDPDHDINITQSTISGNTAGADGGGVYLYSMDNGTFTIDATTISGNTAGDDGGGVYLYDSDHPFFVTSSTISGNSAAGSGGGMEVPFSGPAVSVSHSTIAGNTATSGSGGLSGDSFSLSHDIVADNTLGGGSSDVNVSSLTAAYSLVEQTLEPGTGNITGDPALSPLANNGGPTRTQLPSASSVVIDAGDPALGATPATDQRGQARISGARVDIGAVELQPGEGGPGAPPVVSEHLNVTAPGSVTVGTPFQVTITQTKDDGTVDTGANGAAQLQSSDPAATLPATQTLQNGTVTTTVTLNTVGNQTLLVSDPQHQATTGASSPIAVMAVSPTPTPSPTASPGPVVNPTLTAKVTSAAVKTSFGWYHSPVVISYTCTKGSAPLTTPCPSTLKLYINGRARTFTRSIDAADGGKAKVTTVVNIDQTKPVAKAVGVRNGATYTTDPRITCSATDNLSGIARCTVTKVVSGHTVTYTVKATDKAGNVGTATGSYKRA